MALLLRNLSLIEASDPIQLTDLGDELYEKRPVDGKHAGLRPVTLAN